jgi:hypothetical protein
MVLAGGSFSGVTVNYSLETKDSVSNTDNYKRIINMTEDQALYNMMDAKREYRNALEEKYNAPEMSDADIEEATDEYYASCYQYYDDQIAKDVEEWEEPSDEEYNTALAEFQNPAVEEFQEWDDDWLDEDYINSYDDGREDIKGVRLYQVTTKIAQFVVAARNRDDALTLIRIHSPELNITEEHLVIIGVANAHTRPRILLAAKPFYC